GYRRIACSEPCDVGLEGDGRHGVVWNVSALGLYVVMEPAASIPQEGETMRLSFTLPDEETRVVCQGRVAWRNLPSIFKGCGAAAAGLPPGCGFEFIDLKPA